MKRPFLRRALRNFKYLWLGFIKLAAVNHGDQLSLESFQDNRHALFNGKAMLIVRTREGQAGTIKVTARSAGLEPANVSLKVSR